MDGFKLKSLLLILSAACFALVTACSPAPEPDRDSQFAKDWPTDLVVPIEGATFSLVDRDLPGGSVEYRESPHQGFDFSNGYSGRPLSQNEAAVAVAAGEIIRIDQEYAEPEPDVLAFWASIVDAPGHAGSYALDRVHGRQVWIRHEKGYVSRYAHLSRVNPELAPGDTVEQGQPLGLMGNSGLLPSEEQPDPPPRLHFELWSPDGSTYFGRGLSPLKIHQQVAASFGVTALPRFARTVVEHVNDGGEPPETYPPREFPETEFSVDPPQSVQAGKAFVAPITWEGEHFEAGDFFAQLEGQPLGILDAPDGAWIIGGMPWDSGGQEFNLTIGAINEYGQTLAGGRSVQSMPPEDPPLPAEVAPEIFALYSQENLRTEAERILPVILNSLSSTEPQWNRPFRPPLEGDVVGEYGQRIFHGVLRPDHPRPGLWIRPDAAQEVLASNAGTVAMADDLPTRGKTVAIAHGGGIVTVYAQLDEIDVADGDQINRGQKLGRITRGVAGDMGALRWELHVGGIPVDPAPWLGQILPRSDA
ncbi:M23 family metallopeptidase [Wenzhouxiangella sp. XN201]|uniref:peptidoglycan DD-metalloendopeptidase family protein n=1 Tax=Wenzhouxiangella sp. XN201 TaxID=2710755 RepID=UPI0013C594C8|nr:peptidoglycan DD-metalloendopeptidase family protein [Wenzhouxiangella sp. XN201]NEZ04103.1 M23 family metallopeptidase [Wenzhouxiangella sp. XN201]